MQLIRRSAIVGLSAIIKSQLKPQRRQLLREKRGREDKQDTLLGNSRSAKRFLNWIGFGIFAKA